MHICFEDMTPERIEHFMGGDGFLRRAIYQDPGIKIMRGTLAPGHSIGLHTHTTSSEIIYILSGTATLQYDDTTETVTPGQCHYCPRGHTHAMYNKGDTDLCFFAVVPELEVQP